MTWGQRKRYSPCVRLGRRSGKNSRSHPHIHNIAVAGLGLMWKRYSTTTSQPWAPITQETVGDSKLGRESNTYRATAVVSGL